MKTSLRKMAPKANLPWTLPARHMVSGELEQPCCLLICATFVAVLFIGINDVGEGENLSEIVGQVLDAAHTLYIKAGARNFVFFDVPPTDRAPEGSFFVRMLFLGLMCCETAACFTARDRQTARMRVEEWNELLREGVAEFQQDTPQANIAVFSAHAVLTDILDRPQEYADFDESDVIKEGGRIWDDEIHVTSDANQIFALRLLEKVQ